MSETSIEKNLTTSVQEALFLDSRNLAEAIIEQIGYDYEENGDEYSMATWSAWFEGPQFLKFTLYEEIEEGEVVYQLDVQDVSDSSNNFTYKFDRDYLGISVFERDEFEKGVFYEHDQPTGILAEKQLRQHLKTAPIVFEKIDVDSHWGEVFQSMMFSMARDDAVLAKYHQGGFGSAHEEYHKVFNHLAHFYDLSYGDVYLLIDPSLAAEAAAKIKDNNGQA